MKIIIKNNGTFGGYIGWLINNNESIVKLPIPFLISAMKYSSRSKRRIIELCLSDAKEIFNIDSLQVVDETI